MQPNPERAVVTVQSQGLIDAKVIGNRILVEMVGELLALERKHAVSLRTEFKIGDYILCEPDYRQILLWAEQFKMEAVEFFQTLIAVKPHRLADITTKFEGGQIRSLRWDLDRLPISDMMAVEGVEIEEIKLHSYRIMELRLLAAIFKDPKLTTQPKDPKLTTQPNRIIRLTTPTLRRLDYRACFTQLIFPYPMWNLQELNCSFNGLNELSLTLTPSLKNLSCKGNQLAGLDLSLVPTLTELDCGGNQLTELDLSYVPNLTKLLCEENQLVELDLSHVPSLTNLQCGANPLTKINLSHMPSLKILRCSEDQLAEIDLSNVPNLMSLKCGGNQLTKLDLSHVPNLTELYCWENQLTGLDFSHAPNLKVLWCCGNRLTELDIRPLRNLVKLVYDSDKTRLIQRPDQNF